MLHIYFGMHKDTVLDPDTLFDMEYEDDWLDNELVKEMILDVDRSKVLGNRVIESPVLGLISPEHLSGGVKTLILLLFDTEYRIDGSSCGDNCAKWILKIAEIHDITLDFCNTMLFPQPFRIHILNDDTYVTTVPQLASAHNRLDVGGPML